MAEYTTITQEFAPVFDENSEILILGTLPSVKSRQSHFFYGNPQNRFWRVLAALFAEEVPQCIEDKKKFLLKHKIAIWDVVAKCDIIGSGDSSIKNVEPADLSVILSGARIKKIFANGAKAFELYQKYSREITDREIMKLPSTSPANAVYSLEKLCLSWKQILFS